MINQESIAYPDLLKIQENSADPERRNTSSLLSARKHSKGPTNGRKDTKISRLFTLNPNRSSDFGEIARLCHAACFSPSRRRSGLRRGVARNRMRTEAGKMPESLIFLTENSPGVSNDRFGLKTNETGKQLMINRRPNYLSETRKTTQSKPPPWYTPP